MRTSYPPSSVNAPCYCYSKLQLHGTEESRNRRRSSDGDRAGDPPAQKAAHQPTELGLLLRRIYIQWSRLPEPTVSKTSQVSFISFEIFKLTPLDTLLLRRPCRGWWHFLEGQYVTPSKARCFGQITISSPFRQTNWHEQVLALSHRLHRIVMSVILSSSPLHHWRKNSRERTAYERDI